MDKIHKVPNEFYDGKRELLIIDDSPLLTINDLRSRTKRIISIHKPKLIIIDYLQLMKGTDSRRSREQEISEISRGVKMLAKETGIPIVALSQLSRDVEKRGGQSRPKLSDLRESGSIEQDSDIVIFLYRPWYYYIQNDNQEFATRIVRGEDVSTENFAEVIIAKHRQGALKNIPVKFTDYLTKFEDWPAVYIPDITEPGSPIEKKEDDPF